MQLRDLSPVAQDYLKVIWSASEWSSHPVTITWLAQRLAVSASTASETVRRLSEQGLVQRRPYGPIALTAAGATLALGMVRRHRLLETFLVNELGYSWDEVHAEAEVLEHAVSDVLVDRIDARLGHPDRDPHGDSIPSSAGQVPNREARQLSALAAGEQGTVARISDADPKMLRYFASVGIVIDRVLTMEARKDFAGVVQVRTSSHEDVVTLGEVAARSVFLTNVVTTA